MNKLFVVLIFLSSFFLTGCAGKLANQEYNDQVLHDPYEKVNRVIYTGNMHLDNFIVKPAAKGYQTITPSFLRIGVSNFLSNLEEPRNFINNLLQLKFEESVQSFGRFAFNSTFGIVGIFDIMTEVGIEQKDEDFGQTLAYWGVKPGPYVFLPLFGPSSVRDTVGRVGDYLMLSPRRVIEDPTLYQYQTALDIIDLRTSLLPLDPILERQIDVYNFLKSGYEQSRIDSIFDGNAPEIEEDF